VAFCSGVEWLPFSWEAFATIFTGLAAVVGAVVIGLKQSKIAQKQADIQDAQRKDVNAAREQDRLLQFQNYQVSLLDRRSEFVQKFRTVWTKFLQDGTLSDEDWRELVGIFHTAQLIYPTAIVVDLDRASTSIMRAKLHNRRADSYHQSGQETKAQEQLDKAFAADDTAVEAMQKLLDRVIDASRVIAD
jgi:hypothetical protein